MNPAENRPQPGLRRNAPQFALLVLVNAFTGAMIGLERSVLPGMGQSLFGLGTHTVLFSFIMAFGITKALANYSVAGLTKRFSRKQILLAGWMVGLPAPLLLMYAPHWNWVIAANILLGIQQGLSWSAAVIMKVDIAGPRRRGLAMGMNEFAGYLSVGGAAWLSAELATRYGYAWYPFLPGLFFAGAGLLITLFFVKDTTAFVHTESAQSRLAPLRHVWRDTTWRHKNIGTVTLNGLVNNMNDAMVWGLLPLLMSQRNFSGEEIGLVAGIYPAVWGLLQLFTGALGDTYCKKQIISLGMWVQAAGILLLALGQGIGWLVGGAALLGVGTALVYPNFLTVVAESTHPAQRAESLSIFRFWRDSGYVFGALLTGLLADWLGMVATLLTVASLTALAGAVAHFRMCCTLKKLFPAEECASPAAY